MILLTAYKLTIVFALLKQNYDISVAQATTSRLDTYSESLLEIHVLFCGYDYLCNSFKIQPSNFVKASYDHLDFCPQCSCDDRCLITQNCCLDKFFEFPLLNCTSVEVLRNDERKRQKSVLLIESCPPGTPADIVDKCTRNRTLFEYLQLPPTTAKRNEPITYKNVHCSKCNSVFEYEEWDLNISCVKFADFNFLSSFEEFLELASKKRCNVHFRSDNASFCYDENEEAIYSKCNTTGNWLEYNKAVDVACSSNYINKYGVFKNIFCFICNPPKIFKYNMISECNVTGMWDRFNSDLLNACRTLSSIRATQPFKNIFCYLCNVKTNFHNTFADVNVEMEAVEDIYDLRFSYTANNIQYAFEYFLFRTLEQKSISFDYKENPNYMNSQSVRQQNVNMTNLLELNTHYFHGRKFCDPKFFGVTDLDNGRRKDCVCQPKCDGQCCNDFALSYPVTLFNRDVNPVSLSNRFSSTLVVDGCFQKTVITDLDKLCSIENFNSSDIYEYLPITYNKTSYKNIYCYLCNRQNLKDLNFLNSRIRQPFVFWDITMKCNSYIHYQHSVFLYDVLLNADHMQCRIMVLQKNNSNEVNTENSDAVGKCNNTGQWFKFDKDLQWACEDTETYRLPAVTITDKAEIYKNEFCIMCNYDNWSQNMIIEACNVTGMWDVFKNKTSEKCKLYPMTKTTFPYKNEYCKRCNEGIKIQGQFQYPQSTKSVQPKKGTTFRSILAFSEYEKHEGAELQLSRCSHTQYFDKFQQICRNLSCFQGKLLTEEEECRPLFQRTSNLRYSLTFRLYGNLTSRIGTTLIKSSLWPVVFQKLENFLGIRQDGIQYEKWNVLYQVCNKTGNPAEVYIDLYVNMRIFLQKLVSRMEIERAMLKFMSSSFVFKISAKQDIHMESHQSRKARFIDKLMTEINNSANCEVALSDKDSAGKWDRYSDVHVSNIIVCKRVWFGSDEIRVDPSGEFLIILPFDIKIHFNDFQILSNKDVFVCLDKVSRFMDQSSNIISQLSTALSYLTFLCSVTSLVCLALTFITYCLFSQLRTLPGKNTMLLMVSLFCAHLCFMMTSHAKENILECKLIGMAIHYFWLCVFGNFNICCFCIFRTFSSRFSRTDSQSNVNITVLKMSLYSYGTPALVVGGYVLYKLFSESDLTIGYGGNNCFLTSKTAFILTFLTPIILMNMFNVFCFISTLYYIQKHSKFKGNKDDFFIYVRLFLVTGSVWTLQIVDAFLPLSILSFIIAVLNGFQGLFLFVSYVCKRRVFQMYSTLFTGNSIQKSRENSRDNVDRNTSVSDTYI